MERLGFDSTTAAAHEEEDDEQIAKAKKKARAKEKKEKLKLREAKERAKEEKELREAKAMIASLELTGKQLEKYDKMVEESDGFDVPYFSERSFLGMIVPNRYMEIETFYKFNRYAKLAIADYNKREGTHFKFAKLIKVNTQHVRGHVYYMTFEVKPDGAPDDDDCTCRKCSQVFQARMWKRIKEFHDDDDDCTCKKCNVFQARVWDGIKEFHVQLCRPKRRSTLVKQAEEGGVQVRNISKQELKDDVDTMVVEPSSLEFQLLKSSMKKMEEEINNLKIELQTRISHI